MTFISTIAMTSCKMCTVASPCCSVVGLRVGTGGGIEKKNEWEIPEAFQKGGAVLIMLCINHTLISFMIED